MSERRGEPGRCAAQHTGLETDADCDHRAADHRGVRIEHHPVPEHRDLVLVPADGGVLVEHQVVPVGRLGEHDADRVADEEVGRHGDLVEQVDAVQRGDVVAQRAAVVQEGHGDQEVPGQRAADPRFGVNATRLHEELREANKIDVKRAVEIACEVDTSSGGEVVLHKLKG